MGNVKNAFHDEICAAADDQRADEFDCYEARLHQMLSDLDWLESQRSINKSHRNNLPYSAISNMQSYIKRLMK